MKRADFFASMHTAAPGSTPEAVQKMIDFAVERVQQEQYANFTPSIDQQASVERWLDTLCGGVYAVRAEFGPELAGKLVNLSLDNCGLYPGEMLQAAACLRDGGTAETILQKISTGEIESQQPFLSAEEKTGNAAAGIKREKSMASFLAERSSRIPEADGKKSPETSERSAS